MLNATEEEIATIIESFAKKTVGKLEDSEKKQNQWIINIRLTFVILV